LFTDICLHIFDYFIFIVYRYEVAPREDGEEEDDSGEEEEVGILVSQQSFQIKKSCCKVILFFRLKRL
jgi:hypothetical protein